jgi:hypothetical protein
LFILGEDKRTIMRNGTRMLIASLSVLAVLTSCGDEANDNKVSIKQEVRMENENGVKTLTITTTENGVESEEIFTGEKAEQKIHEMEAENEVEDNDGEMDVQKEVKVTDDNGKKKMIIKTVTNGVEKTETYTGKDVDVKIKELDGQ